MDKKFTNREQELMNRGWSELQQILEKEMPQSKRRRFGWLFWALALLFICSSAGLAWYATKPVSRPTLPARPTGPVASQEHQAMPAGKIPSVLPAPAAATRSIRNAAPVLHATSVPKPLQTTVPSENVTSQNVASGNVSQHLVQIPVPENTTLQAVLAKDWPAVAPFEALALNVPGAVAVAKATAGIPEAKQTKPYRHRYLRPGVYAGGAWSNGSAGAMSAGLLLDWQIRGRWGLRAGAGYQNMQLNSGQRPLALVTGDTYLNIIGDTAALTVFPGTSAAGNEEVLVPIERLHRLELPLQLWFEPVHRLRVYTGACVNYTFLGTSADNNLALGLNRLVSVESADQKSELSQIASETLKRWSTQFTLGVGYQIGRHLELGIGYKTALEFSPIRSKEQSADTNSLIDSYNSAAHSNSAYDKQVFQVSAVYKF